MCSRCVFLATAILTALPATIFADGLIRQLPEDSTWARFEVKGEGIAPDGTVDITIKGHQTLRSVGKTMMQGAPCRWIEIHSEMEFTALGKPEMKFSELQKLLIPEEFLTKDADPRQYVKKAYKREPDGTVRNLNLEDPQLREIQGLDEIFHAPLLDPKPLEPIEIKTKQRTFECEGFTSDVRNHDAGTVFVVETYHHEDAPFGVVTYRYEKLRSRNGIARGKRNMSWTLVDFGSDAESALPDAK